MEEITCDTCENVLEIGEGVDYWDAIDVAVANGWRNGEDGLFCPLCLENIEWWR
jgi:hypothetical protein